ncbi:MAG: hypothetical protein LBP36_00160 [Oscillospiraceae bacterium]|jgi:hypothetical protein|nr:hypothetical protein [Oscillospiraceae bacterium]
MAFGGSLLKRIKEIYKDDPKATAALDNIIRKNSKVAKDDSETQNAKVKKVDKYSKDDSGITEDEKQKRKALIRKELDDWGENNEPEESWGLTDNRYKEIRLRKKFLEEKPGMSWVEYLKNNGLEIIGKTKIKQPINKPKVARYAKDDSSPEVLKVQRENLSKRMNTNILASIDRLKSFEKAKEDSEFVSVARKIVNLNDDEECKCVNYFKKFLEISIQKITQHSNNNPILDSIRSLINLLNGIEDKDIDEKTVSNIKTVIDQMSKISKTGR